MCNQATPHILVVGEPGAPSTHYFVADEKETLLESQSMADAILDVVATYHVFDIPYPKSLEAILVFLEHYGFGLNIRSNASVPIITSGLVSNLNRVA